MPEIIRELTFADRAKYGYCEVCGSQHGEPCDPHIGIPLGLNAEGNPAAGGAHLARLRKAPHRVKEVRVT